MLSTPTVQPATEQAVSPTPGFTDLPLPTLNPSPTVSATAIPSATPTATALHEGCNASLNTTFDKQVFTLVNQERTSRGLPAFQLSMTLSKASRAHSLDMACHNFASHTGSNGSFFGTRLTEAGFTFSTAAENIAAGYPTPEKVVKGWMNSSGHRANILNPDLKFIGIGYIYNPDSVYKDYWTTDFGTP